MLLENDELNDDQCCLKCKLELANESDDKKVVIDLDKNILIGILNYRMEEVKYRQ